jgi:hypothetical protein
MKRAFYSLVAIFALLAISSCENGVLQSRGLLENKVSLYEGFDLNVYNGEVIMFEYQCQFTTTVDIVVSDSNNKPLQELSREIEPFPAGGEPGYKVFQFSLDVGDYRGNATLKMTYEDVKKPATSANVKSVVKEMVIGDRGAVTLDDLRITRTFEEIVHFSVSIGDADLLAYTWMPANEYVEQSADEIFEKGWMENMRDYGLHWGGYYENPKTYTTFIDKLTPDTEYVLQLAAKNDFSVATKQITFRTKAPEPKIPDVEFLNLSVASNTANAITLAAEIANTEQLSYHICKGDACDCEFELYMASLISVWYDNGESFEKPITVTFEIKNLQPNTSYYIDVHAGARYSSQKRTIVVTTAQAE